MKKSNLTILFIFLCISASFLFTECKDSKQSDKALTRYTKVCEEFHLNNTTQSPSCKVNINFCYLNYEKDSASRNINKSIIEELLGKQYGTLQADIAVDSFKNAYITSYKNEVGLLYAEEIRDNPNENDMPSWYNYEYELYSDIAQGKSGILNMKASIFEYTGGAHPNEWGKWMNFYADSGKLINIDDVFMKGSQDAISQLLLKKLIDYISNKYTEEKVESIENLHSLGILSDSKMYLSENFILGEDEISFLYNKYDIAPYSTGSIILSLPYSEVEKYMLH